MRGELGEVNIFIIKFRVSVRTLQMNVNHAAVAKRTRQQQQPLLEQISTTTRGRVGILSQPSLCLAPPRSVQFAENECLVVVVMVCVFGGVWWWWCACLVGLCGADDKHLVVLDGERARPGEIVLAGRAAVRTTLPGVGFTQVGARV